jgi:hypothetical protein
MIALKGRIAFTKIMQKADDTLLKALNFKVSLKRYIGTVINATCSYSANNS